MPVDEGDRRKPPPPQGIDIFCVGVGALYVGRGDARPRRAAEVADRRTLRCSRVIRSLLAPYYSVRTANVPSPCGRGRPPGPGHEMTKGTRRNPWPRDRPNRRRRRRASHTKVATQPSARAHSGS